MNVVEVENVSKRFRLGERAGDLRERVNMLLGRDRAAREAARELWAVRDVSFTVAQGESFGIIGHNGSGKSTMLKMLTGIYKPNRGTLRTQGRVAALIEVGAGFHPELTGRENVYLNGSIMGMKKREVDQRFDEIVEFAELAKFIDTPVKRYSSGMYMRLGFSVAAHVNPDIVLVDEVLAVGDEAFQAKCMRRMKELRHEGKTLVFVSHSMDAVSSLCQRVILLSRGKMLTIGRPEEVITAYRTSLAMDQLERKGERREGDAFAPLQRDMEILGTRLLDSDGRERDTFEMGEMVRLECAYRANTRVERPAFGVAIYRADDLYVFGPNTKVDGLTCPPIEGEGTFSITYPSMLLKQGVYRFVAALFHEDDTHHAVDGRGEAAIMTITSRSLAHGVVELPHEWRVGPASPPAGPEALDVPIPSLAASAA